MNETRPKRRPESLSNHPGVVAEAMTIFSTVYRESVTPQLIEIYQGILGHLTVKDFKEACGYILRTSKFFPKPADILEAVEHNYRQAAREASYGTTQEAPGLIGGNNQIPRRRTHPNFEAAKDGLARLAKTLNIAKR